MGARDEVETAYFTLLRARDELEALRRFEDVLRDDRRRILRFQAETTELSERTAPRFRRVLHHTDQPLTDALRVRLTVIEEELGRLPDRIAAAEAHVEESERAHAELKHSA